MRRSIKLALGLLSLWPAFYILCFVLVMALAISSGFAGEEPQLMEKHFFVMFAIHVATMLEILGLTIFYIIYIFKSDHVPKDKKALWAVVVFLGHMIAMPIFWYLYVWREPVKATTSVPGDGTNEQMTAEPGAFQAGDKGPKNRLPVVAAVVVVIIVVAVMAIVAMIAIQFGSLRKDHDSAIRRAVWSCDIAKLLSETSQIKGQSNRAEVLNAALTSACDSQCDEAVEQLLKMGANPNAGNGKGPEALYLAACGGNLHSVRLLLDYGAQADSPSSCDGETALMGAAGKGNLSVVQELIHRGASVDLRDTNGRTALYGAACRGASDVIASLLSAGAQVDARSNDDGLTPLMAAVKKGHRECIKALVDAGADLKVRDAKGMSLIQLATQSKQPTVAEYLKTLGATEK